MSEYFVGFNYSLANEDTNIELKLAKENPDSMFVVCGSGSRSVPLLSKNPKELHVVDLSIDQLMLFKLRYAANKALAYDEFLYFLGYNKASVRHQSRADLFMKLDLDEKEKEYWKSKMDLWKDNGVLYLGKWEKHFMMLGRFYQKTISKNLRPIFEAKSLAEQKEILSQYWKPLAFKIYTHLVMNPYVANKLLYKGHFAGGKNKNTMKISAAELVYQEFNDLFQNTWVRANYFVQLIFLNEVAYREAFPPEAQEEIFDKVKKSESKIFLHQDNLLSVIGQRDHEFYSLSDTFSYMSDGQVQNFFDLLAPNLKPETKIVIRSFMRNPDFPLKAPWNSDTVLNTKLHKEDCTRMYEFKVLSL